MAYAHLEETHRESLFNDLEPAHVSRIKKPNPLCGLEAFCAAFYHVNATYEASIKVCECLIKPAGTRTGCRFVQDYHPENPKYYRQQPKDVALLAVLTEDNKRIWISSFTNCCQCFDDREGKKQKKQKKQKKHAEDFLIEDAMDDKNPNSLGSISSDFQPADCKSRVLTIYITYQPCHFSFENSMDKSCTDAVITLYEENLKPKGVDLVIKPTHIAKAFWKKKGEDIEIDNANAGMRKLALQQIETKGSFALMAMVKDDWEFLTTTLEIPMPLGYNYEASDRKKLDIFLGRKLEGWMRMSLEEQDCQDVDDRHVNNDDEEIESENDEAGAVIEEEKTKKVIIAPQKAKPTRNKGKGKRE